MRYYNVSLRYGARPAPAFAKAPGTATPRREALRTYLREGDPSQHILAIGRHRPWCTATECSRYGRLPGAARTRAVWDTRVDSWHEHVSASPAFEYIRQRLMDYAAPRSRDRAVDLGAGTGFVTLELANRVASVLAVDVSEAMAADLARRAAATRIENVQVVTADLGAIDLRRQSLDLIVSNYALHHLCDADKLALLERAVRWLRPGGRIVIADMMFGRGRTPHDRRIIAGKIRALLRKGPAGAYRVAKNLVRFGLRQGSELPASPEFWIAALNEAGFADVEYQPLIAEAGLVVGHVPAS